MIKSASAALAAIVGAALLPSPGRAQDLTAMYNAQVARQNQYFQQMQNQMVQDNLNNPQVMAAYRAGVCGPGLTPQQFAYKWSATGGCTAQGMQAYMNTSRQMATQDQASWQAYQQAQAARSQAMQQQQQGFSENQNQAGMQLGGWKYVYRPDGSVFWYR